MLGKSLRKKSSGQTLVEILVAIGLFATASMLALEVFVNVTRMQGRIALENAIYEDARFMMERMSRAVRSNTVDYEEYFNKGISATNQYGDLYGCYAAQFYNPGLGKATDYDVTPGNLGAFCTDGTGLVPYVGQENCVVYKPSVDFNTGRFPYSGSPKTSTPSNAFCPAALLSSPGCAVLDTPYSVDQLYLIDRDGKTKTIFALKTVNDTPPESALAILKLTGKDANNDGITEQWRNCGLTPKDSFCCASGFDCEKTLALPNLESTLTYSATSNYVGFVPISPLRSNVTGLKIMISPSEDPHKAFAEGSGIVMQPKVTIILTVKPTQAQLNKYGNLAASDVPSVTLQTTISSRIQSEVKSYLGSGTYGIGAELNPTPPVALLQTEGGYCPLQKL